MKSSRPAGGNHRPTSESDAVTPGMLRDAELAVRNACEAVATPHDSDPACLHDARALGSIVDNFFAMTETESFPGLLLPLKTRDEYVREIVALKETMVTFRQAVAAIRLGRNGSTANGRLQDSIAGVVRQMDRVVKTYRDIVNDSCDGATRQKAWDIAEATDSALAGYDRGHDREHDGLLGEPGELTGSAALGAYFSACAAKERKLADRLRWGVIFILLAIAALVIWILFISPLESGTLAREFAQLSTTVPLAVLAGYLGRESSRHRNTAERSAELGAHFSNLDGYVATLSRKEARRYRYELGQRACTADRYSADEASAPSVAEGAARFVEMLKGAFRS